jgi:dTDP-glucose 4,6-dehydratase
MIVHELGRPESLIQHVRDRVGHDRRYAVRCDRIAASLSAYPFEATLRETIRWYVDSADWWQGLKAGTFQRYYRQQYQGR